MSAISTKRTIRTHPRLSAIGVTADISEFWPGTVCPLMTQSGHQPGSTPSSRYVEPVRSPAWGLRNETARVHHTCQRRGGDVAAQSARAAAGDAGDRLFKRCVAWAIRAEGRCIPPGLERSRLRRGPERGDRKPLGRRGDTSNCPHWRPIGLAGRSW